MPCRCRSLRGDTERRLRSTHSVLRSAAGPGGVLAMPRRLVPRRQRSGHAQLGSVCAGYYAWGATPQCIRVTVSAGDLPGIDHTAHAAGRRWSASAKCSRNWAKRSGAMSRCRGCRRPTSPCKSRCNLPGVRNNRRRRCLCLTLAGRGDRPVTLVPLHGQLSFAAGTANPQALGVASVRDGARQANQTACVGASVLGATAPGLPAETCFELRSVALPRCANARRRRARRTCVCAGLRPSRLRSRCR